MAAAVKNGSGALVIALGSTGRTAVARTSSHVRVRMPVASLQLGPLFVGNTYFSFSLVLGGIEENILRAFCQVFC